MPEKWHFDITDTLIVRFTYLLTYLLLRGEVGREGEGVRWGGEGSRGKGKGKVVPPMLETRWRHCPQRPRPSSWIRGMGTKGEGRRGRKERKKGMWGKGMGRKEGKAGRWRGQEKREVWGRGSEGRTGKGNGKRKGKGGRGGKCVSTVIKFV